MENEEKDQFLKKDIFSQNHNPSSNSNNLISSKNNQNDENNKNQLKLGQFMLTPLEGFLLNKKMPHGYKFETEENILKLLESSKNPPRRVKMSDRHGDHQKHQKLQKNPINEEKNNNINKEYSNINNNSNNNIKKINKVIPKENASNININININKNNNNYNNSESYKIMMKCYSGFNKIKSNPISNFFYQSKFPNSPSLSIIEKKIKNFEYKTVNDFCDDLRKLWTFQFKNYAKEPNIYQNICKISVLSDQICKELSNDKIIENKKEEISNIKKRTDKIKKDLDEIKGNNQPEMHNNNKNIRHKSIEEINRLSQLIRSLNREQLKGIIYILSDKNENNNKKTFEFDLEQLPYDQYKKLEEYVYNCKNGKNTNINNINNNHKNMKANNNINKNENKNIKNNNEIGINDKINKNNNINNNIINKNIINKEKNSNNYNTNYNNNTQNGQKKEEKKMIPEKKSFSDSDSMSSESSISN